MGHILPSLVLWLGIVVWRFEKCFATGTECHPVLSSGEPRVAACGASRSRTAAPHQIRTKDAVFKVPARNSNLLIFRSVLAKRILGEGGRRRNASGNHQQTFLNNKSQSEPLRRAQIASVYNFWRHCSREYRISYIAYWDNITEGSALSEWREQRMSGEHSLRVYSRTHVTLDGSKLETSPGLSVTDALWTKELRKIGNERPLK